MNGFLKKTRWVFLISCSVLLSHSQLSFATDCSSFNATADSALSFLKRTDQITPKIWSGYESAQANFVLLSAKQNLNCGVIVKGGEIVSRPLLSQRVLIANGLFSWFRLAEGETINDEVKAIMNAAGITRAILYYVDFDFQALGLKPYQIAAGGLANVTLTTLVHEGFHLFGQINGVNWPAWASPEGRDEVAPRCYRATQQVEKLYRSESVTLLKAAQLAATNETQLAKEAAKDFLKIRAQRRALIETDFCNSKEAALEMVEGVAQWTGLGVDFITGGVRLDQLVQYLRDDIEYDANYYNFGMLQLYTLWKIVPGRFSDITKSLQSAQDWTAGIENTFRQEFAN